MTFKSGDIIKYKPEWCEANERDVRLMVVEAFDDVQRLHAVDLTHTVLNGVHPCETLDYRTVELAR